MVLYPSTALAGIGPLGTPELIILFVLFVLLPGTVVVIVLGVIALSNRSARRKSEQVAPTPPPLAPIPPPHPKAPAPPPAIRALSEDESGPK